MAYGIRISYWSSTVCSSDLLGDSSIAVLRRKLEHLAEEFRGMAAIDATLPPARRRSAGMLLALRPWVFSLLDSLRGAEPGQTDTGKVSGGLHGAAPRHLPATGCSERNYGQFVCETVRSMLHPRTHVLRIFTHLGLSFYYSFN